jgi:prephenate dehydrogenase
MEKTTITIVGLGQIGTSIGLALQAQAEHFTRIGLTRDHSRGNQAKDLGAVDKVAINLPSAVSQADIVVLALPYDEVQETLKVIAEDIKEGALILDTSPVPSSSLKWAEEILPADTNYVAFTPVLNPENLLKSEGGMEAASAELFSKGVFAINSTKNTTSQALNFAGDFAGLLQSSAMFAEVSEIDSYMAAVHLLPQLLAASLANTRTSASGWGEARKLAGRPYAQVTNVVLNVDRAGALAGSSVANKEHMLRVLDEVIADLQETRADIAEDDSETLKAKLKKARKGRGEWIEERRRADWLRPDEDMEGVRQAGNILGAMFGFAKPRPKREKKERD